LTNCTYLQTSKD